MKTITKKYNVYSFDELTEEGKERAIEKLFDLNVNYEWWDGTYDDAKNIGLQIEEFDLDRGSYVKGKFMISSLDVADAIMKDHGKQCETYKTAAQFKRDFKKLPKDEREDFSNDNDLAEEFLKSLCEDYRIILQGEYEYLTSEEAIIESIHANEYEFTADGKIFSF